MIRNLNNKDCRLYGTPYCAILNQKSCESCYVSKINPAEQPQVAEDIFYIAQALPEEGVENIINDDRCVLCRRKSSLGLSNRATMYAQMDMGHLHPFAKVGYTIDGDYDRGTSMVIPIQLPVCEGCRKKISLISYLPLAIGGGITLLGLLITSINPIHNAIARYGRVMPFLVFMLFASFGVVVESVLKRSMNVKNDRTVNTRSKRIAAIAPLISRGWFAIGELKDNGMPFVFTEKRLDSGILTGPNQQAILKEIRALGRDSLETPLRERMR